MTDLSKAKLAMFFETLSNELQAVAFRDDVFDNDELCLPVFHCAEAFRAASGHYWYESQYIFDDDDDDED